MSMSNDDKTLKNIYKLSFNTSLAHVIGNITMLAVEEYKNLFPKRFFKSYYINTTLSSRTFINKKTNIVNLKQSKPILSVNPTVSTDNTEFITTSYFSNTFGKDNYPVKGGNPMTSTMFYNKDTSTIVEFSINRMTMNLEIVQTYETYIQQLNALGVMKSSMRIEHPYRFTALVEVPIPNVIMEDLIDRLNLKGKPVNEIRDYISKYSAYPIVYKLENSTGNFRFFFELNTSIQIRLDQPSLSDGEQKDQVYDNFEITQTVNLEFNYADTFYYISDRVMDSSLVNTLDATNMGYYTIIPILTTETGLVIPELNSKGRVFYIASEIIMGGKKDSSEDDVTNITGLLTVYDYGNIDSIAKASGLKDSEIIDKYYDIEVYKDSVLMEISKDYTFDSSNMELTIFKPDLFVQYSVLIYRDNIGLNADLSMLNIYDKK